MSSQNDLDRVRRAPLLEAGRRHRWSAATPAEIAAEPNGLLRDPEVRAIVASDGGRTTLGHLDLIDVEAIRADPGPILGHNDISLLHPVRYARTGLVGFHADTAVQGFGVGLDARQRTLSPLEPAVGPHAMTGPAG